MASILGGVLRGFAADKQRKVEVKAQKENERRAALDRADELARYRESRGSTGSAILPLYFGENDASFEKELAGDIRGMYDATGALAGSPTQQLSRYADIVSRARPAMDSNLALVNDLGSGQLLRDQLGEAEPVFAARTALAGTQRSGALEALQKTLGEIKAIQSRKGFSGDSFGGNLLNLAARREAARTGSMAEAAAGLQNAEQRAAISQGNRAFRLGNTGLPGTIAAQAMALEQTPEAALSQSFENRTAPLNFFRIGNQAPNIAARPMKKAITPSSAIWLNTGAEAADTVAEIAMSYLGGMGGGMGGGGGGGGGSAQKFLNSSHSSTADWNKALKSGTISF